MKDILVEFHKELQLREQCLVNNKEFRSSNQGGELPLSTSALYTDSSKDKQSSRVWCSFCNQNHQSSKCNVVTSTESRKEVLKKKGKCFLCLKQGHLARSCQAHMKCLKCEGAHHVAICGDSQLTLAWVGKIKIMWPVSLPVCMWISLEGRCCCRQQLLKLFVQIMTVIP